MIPSVPVVPNPYSASFANDAYAFTVWMAAAAPMFDAATTQVNQALVQSLLGVTGTSTTSYPIGAGAKTFTTQTGLGFPIGMPVKITDVSNVGNYMKGTVTGYNSSTGALSVTVATVSGSGTIANWQIAFDGPSSGAPTMPVRAITSADTLVASDSGKQITLSGTFTLTASAAASLGTGWYCIIKNIGSGVVTFDPNASELVDGVTSGAINGAYILTCDGTGFSTTRIGAMADRVVLSSGTSWTARLGAKNVKMRLVGGCGAGIRLNSGSYGSAGAGGGGLEVVLQLNPGTAYAYAIGAGGSLNAYDVAGSSGGSTTFTANGVTYTGGGGAGGSGSLGTFSGGTASGAGALLFPGADSGSSASMQFVIAPVVTFLGTKSSGGGHYQYVLTAGGDAGLIILEW